MKQMITLLVFFFVFAKYGEPDSKFMSIHGDVNLAMMETAVSGVDTIGFIYDDQFGGFALNPTNCPPWHRAPTSFHVTSDCSVHPQVSFTRTPSDQYYRARHHRNYPSRGSGSNYIIGHRGSPGEETKSLSKNGVAFAFPDITTRISRRNSEVYCNDKDHTHYKNLLKPTYNRHAVILFGKSNKNKYEKTMKCMAVLKTSAGDVQAARLFTVIIADLAHEPFTFRASSLSEEGALQGAPPSALFYSDVSYITSSLIGTNFVFRTDASSGCPPTITMQPSSARKQGFYFSYNGPQQTMPAIEADASHHCGVAAGRPATGGRPIFRYWCECTE